MSVYYKPRPLTPQKDEGTAPDGHGYFKLHQLDYSLKTDRTDEEKQHSHLTFDRR